MSNPNPSFIVVFKDGVTKDQVKKYADDVNSKGGSVTQQWDIINGFAANIPESFLSSLQGDDCIKYIEPNGKVTTQ